MGSVVGVAEMKAHCSVELRTSGGIIYRYLALKFVSRSWFNLDATWAVMRRTGWHISFVPSAEVTAFIQSPHRPAKPGRHRDACLTNGFSKKVENRAHSVALFAMYYNFVRVHKTLRVTRAMAADVTKRLWEMSDIVDVLEAYEAKAAN